MKYLYIKDQHRRFKFYQNELFYFYLKYIKIYFKNQIKVKQFNFKFLNKKRIQSIGKFRSRINSRCILTNRSKSIYRKFHISRIQLRNFVLQGILPGVRKSNW